MRVVYLRIGFTQRSRAVRPTQTLRDEASFFARTRTLPRIRKMVQRFSKASHIVGSIHHAGHRPQALRGTALRTGNDRTP